jgi:hypothetical protein
VKDQFDIWRFDFPGKGEHSVIFLAREEIRLRRICGGRCNAASIMR